MQKELISQGQPLAPEAKEYFRALYTIVFLIIFIVNVGITIIRSIATWSLPDPIPFIVVLTLLVLLGYLLMVVYPNKVFEYTQWRFDELGLHIAQGIIWRKQHAVPRSRVQHIDVSQGPLQRRFKIAKIVLNTAGTINASVSLTGLSYETATAIRDELLQQDESDAV